MRHSLGGVDDSYFTIVLNTDPYTYLGSRPLSLAPSATLNSGLSVVALRTMSFETMIKLLKDLFQGNPLENSDDLHIANDIDELSVTGYKPFPYQLDGDYLGRVEELNFKWCPHELRLVKPVES